MLHIPRLRFMPILVTGLLSTIAFCALHFGLGISHLDDGYIVLNSYIRNIQTQLNANFPQMLESTLVQLNNCPKIYHLDWKVISKYGNIQQTAQDPPLNTVTDFNVLILTPLSDSAGTMKRYFSLLCTLTYPHERISIALGEDSSVDETFLLAKNMTDDVRSEFAGVTIHKLPQRRNNWTTSQKHLQKLQFKRRQHLAMARNELLVRALDETYDWVLWLDSDLEYYPPNLIQLLLSPNVSVVVPACLMSYSKVSSTMYTIYDRNTWRETKESMEYIESHKDDATFLMLEGYEKSSRLYLTDLRHEGRVVPIDGVGGCCLLVRASLHRKGLVFPPFIFDSHIETEGFGKMATRMGINMYGLPFVNVFHS